VREGGTWWRGARGGDRELRGGPGAVLHSGSMTVEQGGAVGATGGSKKGCSWGGRAPYIASRGGERRAARWHIRGWRNGGREPWARQVSGSRGLRWSMRSERHPVCEAVDWGPRGFVYFPIYPKLAQHGN
jgi:hypothetical protein